MFQSYPKKKNLVFTCLQYISFENTGNKDKIACYEQLFLLPQ